MHVFHAPDGTILWTAEYTTRGRVPAAPHIIVSDPPAGFLQQVGRYIVRGGQLVLRDEIPDEVRADAIAEVNRMRGDARRPWITVLPGQEMIYLDKERQALAYLSDPDPDPGDYPGLAAEVGITAPTLFEVAQVVANLAALWRGISAMIEPACLGAIAQIEGAGTFADIDAAVEDARQALEGPG